MFMKNLLLLSFFSLLLVSSCTCNEGDKDENMTEEGMMNDATTGEATETDATSVADDEMAKMFDKNNYTEEEIKEYRRLHDELDWGNVPGYYPEASTRALTESDTKFLTDWGHQVMLNEIYARHGQTFEDENLKDHFNRQEWYNPTSDNVQDKLTQLEKDNIAFLMKNIP